MRERATGNLNSGKMGFDDYLEARQKVSSGPKPLLSLNLQLNQAIDVSSK